MNIKHDMANIHYGNKKNDQFSEFVLNLSSKVYEKIVNIRNKFYDVGLLETVKVGVPVISVGNLTTGGVGKTPLVIELAKYFTEKGDKVAILSRGYGGTLPITEVNVISDGTNTFYSPEQSGDEPYMMAKQAQGCVVITCKDRVKSAQYAIEKYKVTKIILDDGFQHRHLHRDLNIMLIDSKSIFGNGKMLPAGPLREPLSETKRADKIVIVSKEQDHIPAEKMSMRVADSTSKPTLVFYVEAGDVYNIKTNESLAYGEAVTAVCAIGQPKKFFSFAEKNYFVQNKIEFEDHHAYTKEDLANIKGNILTTEKDAVKMEKFGMDNIFALRLKCRINFEELFG